MKRSYIMFLFLIPFLEACINNEDEDLLSVDKREAEAIDGLKRLLTTPTNGYRLDYRPSSSTGIFLIFLQFNDDGTVRVQSDAPFNSGQFRDQVLTYRVESSQGIELIFETYGIFHYLFEINRFFLGGEFEFLFLEKKDENLLFTSKTDKLDVTTIKLIPAAPGETNLISAEAPAILNQGIFQRESLSTIGSFGNYNFYLTDFDQTLSINFDLSQRTLKVLGIANGRDEASIIDTNSILDINFKTPFSFENDRVILDKSLNLNTSGGQVTLSEIPVQNASKIMKSFCDGQSDSVTRFNNKMDGIGSFQAESTLFQVTNGFKAGPEGFFSIDYIFIYDDDDNSISSKIENVFPNVAAFQWYHGVTISDSTFNGLGFLTVDEFNGPKFYLRGFDFTQIGGYIKFTFNGKNLISDNNASKALLNNFDDLTNEIFAGGEVFLIELQNIEGLYQFYNPCNQYTGLLIQ